MTDVRRLRTPDELQAVDSLYRHVFALGERDTGLNVRLLTAVADNGGAVLGAYDDGALVAFGLSLLARENDGPLHHYSQTVGVDPRREGAGLGRLIKFAQRDAALTDGIDTLRWVFDPLHARNAHFNLDVLGGRIRSLRRDYYGTAAPGLDRGEPTDRCTVEWDLRSPHPAAIDAPVAELAAALPPGGSTQRGPVTLVGVPASWRTLRGTLAPDDALALRARVVGALDDALHRGLVAVSCVRTDDERAVYVFVEAAVAGVAA